MTFPRIEAWNRYWKQYPPTHLLVRAIAIWAGAYKPETTPGKRGTMDDLRAMFAGGKIE